MDVVLNSLLHVIGIGASAGGLEAMLPMFAALRPTGRLSYVVAQHMAKDGHDALVVRLIGRESTLPVVLATDQQTLVADTIHVLPAGKDGLIRGEAIVLRDPLPGHRSTPSVNVLFHSLADAAQGKAVGIVLSGTGTDGMAGCAAIKACGGMTIAQLPAEARFDGMPAAAIGAGVIDELLPVGRIGEHLAVHCGIGTSAAPECMPDTASASLGALLQLVHDVTGIDFSGYKEDTLLRRLDKRMRTVDAATLADYLALARRQPEEPMHLAHQFLVSVSSFFRDHESFRVLRNSLARLLEGKRAGEPLRVWVPACASGEEVLTIAMIARELDNARPLELIGTDLNPEALALATAASYRQTAFREMDSALRARWFEPHGQHWRARPELMQGVHYEARNVLAGAPEGQFDLISCRNLLIYLKSTLQDRLVSCFRDALRPQGLLFIGQSESLGVDGHSLFVPVDQAHRLYRCRH